MRVPYAELHTHSNFSFLDGASHPEELVEEAARLGLDAVALTDHDGMYGVVRFWEAAREVGVASVFGAELSLGLSGSQNGIPDPRRASTCWSWLAGSRATAVCAESSATPTCAARRKASPSTTWTKVVEELRDHCVVLTGCRKGAVRQALTAAGPHAAPAELVQLVDWFGPDAVAVELYDHQLPLADTHNDLLAAIAAELELPTVATNIVHYAPPTGAGSRRRWPRSGAAAAWRRWTAGCRRRRPRSCDPARRCRTGFGGIRARCSGPRCSASRARSTCSWSRRSCRPSTSRTGTPSFPRTTTPAYFFLAGCFSFVPGSFAFSSGATQDRLSNPSSLPSASTASSCSGVMLT